MKYFTALFFTLILTAFVAIQGQDPIRVEKGGEKILLVDLIGEVEQTEGVHFYFDKLAIDSVAVIDMQPGEALDGILDRVLKEAGMTWYRDGDFFYLFRGDPVIEQLPVFEDHIKRTTAQAPDFASEKVSQYIETISISRDNIITVGRAGKSSARIKSRVFGTVLNLNTGEPMIGATIYIAEPELGTISNVDGHFELQLYPGKYTMTVNHMAMKEVEYGLEVLSTGEITIGLENELIELEEITVFDKRRGNVEGMLMGFEKINVKAVKEIPMVMGEKDILKVAQMLPGVQNVGEGSSGFNVRGGSADQNMFYLNNISIYNTSHLFGFFTAFNPDIINDFALYKNNVPAKYGGRIASVFEINTRQGNKEQFFAQGGISPITGHFMMEGPLIRDKVAIVASGRSTYSDWILNRIKEQDIRNSNASFYDGTVGISADLNEDNQLSAFYYRSSDQFALSDRNEYTYSNQGASVAWKHRFTSHFSLDLSLSNSDYLFSNVDKNNISEAYIQDYGIRHTEGRADFVLFALDNHRIEFGLNSVLYNLDRGNITPFGVESRRVPIDLGVEKGLESSIYLSDEFTLVPRLSLLLGTRFSHYGNLGPAGLYLYEEGLPLNRFNVTDTMNVARGEFAKTYTGIEPRAALNYRITSNNSFKASYNRLKQYVFLLSNTIALAPTDQWKLTDYHIDPPVSDQISAGYYHDFPKSGINISLEAYKKWVRNVVEYKDGVDFISGEPIERQVLQGLQNAYGIELMVKKSVGDLTGWVSYTYSRSLITVDGPFDELRINEGVTYPSNYDRPHSFSLVSNYRISRRVSFSSNVVYYSGRPVTLPIAVYYTEGQQYLYYSSRNKYRIPDYFRVDFSMNVEGNLKYKKLAHSFWMLNIYNVTGRENAYSVFYEARDGQISGYKLSIFARPIVTLSWNFKFGNYNSN